MSILDRFQWHTASTTWQPKPVRDPKVDQIKRKSPVKEPIHYDFTNVNGCPPSATKIVRIPAPTSIPIGVLGPGWKPRLNTKGGQRLASYGVQYYQAHLNPLRHSPEDRLRLKDNRFRKTEQMLLEQPQNSKIHGNTVIKEWAHSKLDIVLDHTPRGRHMEYRSDICNLVTAEMKTNLLAIRMTPDFRAMQALARTYSKQMKAWLLSDDGISECMRDQLLLVALTVPFEVRHARTDEDEVECARLMLRQLGAPPDVLDVVGKSDAEINRVLSQQYGQPAMAMDGLAGEERNRLKLTIDIKTKGGQGVETESVKMYGNLDGKSVDIPTLSWRQASFPPHSA